MVFRQILKPIKSALLAAQTVNWLGNFFKSIFLKNFFGFVITISNMIEKKMKVENLRLDPV